MAESFVQVAVDGSGKQIDAFTVTNPTTGATQYRQTVVIGDPVNGQSGTENGALLVESQYPAEGEEDEDLLKLILIELRILNTLIASEFRVRDDLQAMRNDPATFAQT